MPKAGVKVGLGCWSEAEGWGLEAGVEDKNVDWSGAPKQNNKYLNLNSAKKSDLLMILSR